MPNIITTFESLITNLPVLCKLWIILLRTLNLHLSETHFLVRNQQFLDDIKELVLFHIVNRSLTSDSLVSPLPHNNLSDIRQKHSSIIMMEVASYMSFTNSSSIVDNIW